MGNTTSTQRGENDQGDRGRILRSTTSGQTQSQAHSRNFSLNRFHAPTSDTLTPSESLSRRSSNVYGTFTRHISSQSIQLPSDITQPVGADEVVFEQEERPLVNMEDLGMRDAPITHIAAAPLSRRTSTMSRLGSRFLPNAVMRGLHDSGEETPAEGQAHRGAVTGRVTRATERRMSGNYNGRFSLRDSLRTRNGTRTDVRRHSMRSPYSLDVLQDSASVPNFGTIGRPAPYPGIESSREGSWRRRARAARDSISLPLSHIFNRIPENGSGIGESRREAGSVTGAADDRAEHLIPPLSDLDHAFDFDGNGHPRTAISESEAVNPLTSTTSHSSTSGLRRFPHGLRSRSTRINRPREQPPLQHVLHLAASAIATQLSGHANNSMANMQPLGTNGFDGTIQSFVQTLQQAASAQARSNGEHGEDDGHLPPINYLRVFSFPNSEGTTQGDATNNNQNNLSDRMDVDQPNNEERSVTLVLVGVRSMPHGEAPPGDDGNAIGPGLDALLNLPFLPPSNLLRNGSSGALLRRSDNRTRFSSRRNSMSNFNSFPQQYESQRHHRTRSSTTRSTSDGMPLVTPQSTIPSVLSESPPGPVPPPSTPAALSSGQTTPTRRPSSASAMHPTLPDLSEDPATPSDQSYSPGMTHHRRRSDSEFARRPELSSGATRRNGVVEPDTPTAANGGRSWLIYVVGTNVSPDHPAFTMPSLFTDNPTYEDMQLLSSMLGPVKPPVASQSDVTSAGGLYRLVVQDSTLVAEPQSEGLVPLAVQLGDRCLICLCDYEAQEEIRQLNKCKHSYHRECIDEVSSIQANHVSLIADVLTGSLVVDHWS